MHLYPRLIQQDLQSRLADCSAVLRCHVLGQDRFCNRYYLFDSIPGLIIERYEPTVFMSFTEDSAGDAVSRAQAGPPAAQGSGATTAAAAALSSVTPVASTAPETGATATASASTADCEPMTGIVEEGQSTATGVPAGVGAGDGPVGGPDGAGASADVGGQAGTKPLVPSTGESEVEVQGRITTGRRVLNLVAYLCTVALFVSTFVLHFLTCAGKAGPRLGNNQLPAGSLGPVPQSNGPRWPVGRAERPSKTVIPAQRHSPQTLP